MCVFVCMCVCVFDITVIVTDPQRDKEGEGVSE